MHMGRMNDVTLHEDSMYFECGAGARCYDVEQILNTHGYMLPMNPGSKVIASMGGVVACNTIGHMIDACVGKPVDHVMAVEVVLPTGETIETGTKSMRRPSGIDLTRTFVGSEGQFGVLTKIRMRLIADLKKVYVISYFSKPEAVPNAFMEVYRNRVPMPLYGEFLDEETAKIGYKLKGLPPPKGSVALAIAIGPTQVDAINNAHAICDTFRGVDGILNADVIEDPGLQQRLWGTREAILHLIGEHKANWVAIEIAPELSHLKDALFDLKTEIPKTLDVLKNLDVYLYGHVGACSLHALWVIPKEWSNDMKRRAAREAFKVERNLNIKYGGCCGELGQLAGRALFIPQKYGDVYYALLFKLKALFDPKNILNPGNLEGEIG
jgi:glycolate oxidase